ncbi:proline-rich protein 2-like [Falco rusticolus]|uniref:proline-rich protein 2-like n=1 Tax=Falco rusticolus TaxID=120794 RepID=UPI0018865BB4|nr:proline-rich protein 2-like [Falco rusticolus]
MHTDITGKSPTTPVRGRCPPGRALRQRAAAPPARGRGHSARARRPPPAASRFSRSPSRAAPPGRAPLGTRPAPHQGPAPPGRRGRAGSGAPPRRGRAGSGPGSGAPPPPAAAARPGRQQPGSGAQPGRPALPRRSYRWQRAPPALLSAGARPPNRSARPVPTLAVLRPLPPKPGRAARWPERRRGAGAARPRCPAGTVRRGLSGAAGGPRAGAPFAALPAVAAAPQPAPGRRSHTPRLVAQEQNALPQFSHTCCVSKIGDFRQHLIQETIKRSKKSLTDTVILTSAFTDDYMGFTFWKTQSMSLHPLPIPAAPRSKVQMEMFCCLWLTAANLQGRFSLTD